MKRSLRTVTMFAGLVALASCGGGEEVEPGFESVDPYAAEPTATTAPPAEMELDTAGADRVNRGMTGDTVR